MIRSLLIIQVLLITNLSQAQTLTLDTVLHLHLKAVGGQEHWQQIKTCYAEQSYWAIPIYMEPNQRFLGDQMPKSRENYYQYPNQYRMTIYREGEPSTSSIVKEGVTKFYVYQAKREEVLPDRMIDVTTRNFSIYLLGLTPLLLSAYEDNVIAYEGKSEAYEKLCYKLVITDGALLEGRTFIYLDAETYRVYAMVHADAIDKHKIYEDYREVDGLLIPHRISSYQEGLRFEEYTTDKIEINQAIDPSVFTVW